MFLFERVWVGLHRWPGMLFLGLGRSPTGSMGVHVGDWFGQVVTKEGLDDLEMGSVCLCRVDGGSDKFSDMNIYKIAIALQSNAIFMQRDAVLCTAIIHFSKDVPSFRPSPLGTIGKRRGEILSTCLEVGSSGSPLWSV